MINASLTKTILAGIASPGEGWFSYFRLYGPQEAYLDRGWVIPDIEKAKW